MHVGYAAVQNQYGVGRYHRRGGTPDVAVPEVAVVPKIDFSPSEISHLHRDAEGYQGTALLKGDPVVKDRGWPDAQAVTRGLTTQELRFLVDTWFIKSSIHYVCWGVDAVHFE